LGGGQAGPAQDADIRVDLVEPAVGRHGPGAGQHGQLALGPDRGALYPGAWRGVAYPSSNQFIAAWFPQHERGKANGWVFGGVGLGSGTAPPLVAFIIYNYGWHAVFFASAAIGLLMAAIWYKMA